LDLPKEQLEKVKKILKDLTALSLEFDANIAAHKCEVIVSESDLKGLTKNFIDSLQKKEGNYILGCDYPTYFNVMDNCSVESTRKKLYLAFNNRAYPKNMELLDKIIERRDDLAKLLGYESYSHLKLEDQMAKSPTIVNNFLNELVDKAKVKIKKEIETYTKDLPESVALAANGKLKPWDIKFLKNYYKKKYLNLDENQISQYFPIESTITQLLNIYEQFLSIKFKELSLKGFWHEDVKLIEARDKNDNLLGYLLLDLYPRDNKYNHAAEMSIIGSIKNAGINPSVSIVIANFPKSTKTQPSLLKIKDVVTFFHEFGHAIHSLLGITELYSTTGTHVKTDFVEMPSQMLEDWLKDKEILKMVSKHYQTGESLPNDIINTMTELEKFDSGDMVLRQLYFAFLSLKYFEAGKNKNTQAIAEELYTKLLEHLIWVPEDHIQASFGHLTGYGPSYYGYLWSNVYAKDLFNEINKQGLLNPEIGQEYVNKIIGQGGSKDPNDLLVDFLGRKPNSKAFLKSLGFI